MMIAPSARRLRPDDGFAAFVLYEAYRGRADCPSAERFLAEAKAYELAYLMNGANVMGVATRRNGSVHIGVLPAWRGRWATRCFIQTILAWAGQTGRVWTKVAEGNALGERLVQGVGFVKNGERYELQNGPK